jgi:hypothetical protein
MRDHPDYLTLADGKAHCVPPSPPAQCLDASNEHKNHYNEEHQA